MACTAVNTADHQAGLVQLPALLTLGGRGQDLLQRLVDGAQRRIHGRLVGQTVESPAISTLHW
jgi:hypothetical protein